MPSICFACYIVSLLTSIWIQTDAEYPPINYASWWLEMCLPLLFHIRSEHLTGLWESRRAPKNNIFSSLTLKEWISNLYKLKESQGKVPDSWIQKHPQAATSLIILNTEIVCTYIPSLNEFSLTQYDWKYETNSIVLLGKSFIVDYLSSKHIKNSAR